MATTSMSMSELRSNLAEALDQVADGNPVIVTRRGQADAVLVDADLLEDIVSASNPRIIKKIKEARERNETYTIDEAFSML